MAYSITEKRLVPIDWSCGIGGSDSDVGTLDPNDFFFSPAEIEDEMRTLDGYAHSLQDDISKNQKAFSKEDLNEWVRFYREWSEFKKDTGFWKRHTRAARNKTIEYGKRIAAWQARYKAVTGKEPVASRLPEAPSPNYTPGGGELLHKLKPWLLGAGILAGVGYGVKILSETGTLAAIKHKMTPQGT